jgi:ribosome-binding factor A
MMKKQLSRKGPRSFCAEPGPGDGIDPRLEPRQGPDRVPNRKALQLCAQVRRTLEAILAGEIHVDVLRHVFVESVVPAPNASRMLVTVCPSPAAQDADPEVLLARLHDCGGRLRCEIAAEVHRRRTPELIFQVRYAGD